MECRSAKRGVGTICRLSKRKMYKREADFGVLFRHWLRANPRHSCAFELKQSRTDSISFASLEEHQIFYLLAIKSKRGALLRVRGTNGEPDYILLKKFPACVVVRFPKRLHIIDIDDWVAEAKGSMRKSLTDARAAEISIRTVKL